MRPASAPRACLTRLGIERSYVFINTFLYSVFGQGGGSRHIDDPAITKYRNRWINAIVADQQIEAIITLGQLADTAYQQWRATPKGAANTAAYATIRHPTYPESASRSGQITKAEAFAKLCESWNQMLTRIHPVDHPRSAGAAAPVRHDDHKGRPDADPAARPAARAARTGCARWTPGLSATGETAQLKRATITVTVPTAARTWPPVVEK